MVEHTPGPWRIICHHLGKAEWITISLKNPGEVDDKLIAELPNASMHEGINAANAHLIAAAPDLLEAAEEVIQAWRVEGIDSNGFADYQVYLNLRTGFLNLEAAIAAAKGETPETTHAVGT